MTSFTDVAMQGIIWEVLAMAIVEPKDLANAVIGKLYNVLTSGDQIVPASQDDFSHGIRRESRSTRPILNF